MPDEELNTDSGKAPDETGKVLKASDDIPPEVLSVLENLPESGRKIVIASFKSRRAFRGPLPPPEILKGYNDIIPNGAERILQMVEQQAQHRMSLEKTTIAEEQRQSSNGQKYGLSLGLLGIVSTVIMACTGHDYVAGIFGTSTIVALVSVFVYSKRQQTKEFSEKSQP